jgi:hypothetical protein
LAAENELESMVVRLVGDGSQYVKMLQDAKKQTQHSVPVMEQLFTRLEATAKSALGVIASLGVGVGLWSSFEKAAEAERAMVKLEAAIEGNGGAVRRTTEDYVKFAKAMSETTLITKGETLAMLKKAEAFGLTGEKAKLAAQQAIQLGAAGDVDAESALRVTAALNKGDVERAMHMARMIPQLRGIHDSTEFLTTVNRLFAMGQKTLTAEMETSSGQLEHMEHQLKAVTKELGATLAIGIKPAIVFAKDLVEGFTKLDASTKKIVIGTVAMTAAMAALAHTAPIVYAQIVRLTIAMSANPYLAVAAAVVVAAGAFHQMAMESSGANKALDELNESLKRGKELTTEGGTRRDLFISKVVQKGDTGAGQKEIQGYIEDTNKSIAAQEERIKRLKAELEHFGTTGILHGGQGGLIGRALGINSETRDQIKGAIQAAQDALEQARRDKKALEGGSTSVDKSGSVEVLKAVDELNKKLKEQVATYGMSAEQIELYKLQTLGANKAQLDFARSLQREVDAMKQADKENDAILEQRKKLGDAIKSTQDALQEETATAYMSATQKQYYKLQLQGANDVQLETVRGLLALKDAQEEWKKAQEDAKRITEEFLSPIDKYKAKVAELQNLMAQGMLSQDTFSAAMKDAKDNLDRATLAAAGTRSEMEKLDATLNHTAASQAKVDAFLSKQRDSVAATKDKDRFVSTITNSGAGGSNLAGPLVPVLNRIAKSSEVGATAMEYLRQKAGSESEVYIDGS